MFITLDTVPPPAQHTYNLATALLVQEQDARQLVAENSDLLTGVPGMAAKGRFLPEEQQGPAVGLCAPPHSGPSWSVGD